MSHPQLFRLSSALVLVIAAGTPLAAQQRTEVVLRRSPRAEGVDSAERQVRVLQRRLDSLNRVYVESEDLTLAQRRRVEETLGATMEQLSELSMRLAGSGERAPRPSEMVRVMRSPAEGERARGEMSRAMMQVRELEAAIPRGWIGIVAQGPALEPRVEDGQLIVRYFSYPVIVSVDPSSPAQRAGIVPSDTLIAYNGRDVRDNDISLTRLLRPASRINVRVLRDGKLREIPVTVAAAPTRIVQRRASEGPMSPEWVISGVPPMAPFPRSPAPPPSGVRGGSARSGGMAQPGSGTVTTSPGVNFVFTTNGILGAEMSTLTEGLAQAVGVSAGVLVTRAPEGLPANESGLRDGDVIVKLDGRPVASVSQLRALVQSVSNNGERSADAEIVRNRRSQKISLRW